MTVDVEAQCREHGQSQKGETGEAKASRRWCRKRLLLPMMGLMCILIGATIALWPRKPNWVLRSLDILDQEALTFFVMAFGNGGLPGNATSLPRIPFNASASVENPNLLGGTALVGSFKVYDNDDELIASGSNEPVTVPALGSGLVWASGSVELSPTSFTRLTTESVSNALHVNITIKGEAMVRVIFGMHIRARMECDVVADVAQVFGDTREAVVESKECHFKYF